MQPRVMRSEALYPLLNGHETSWSIWNLHCFLAKIETNHEDFGQKVSDLSKKSLINRIWENTAVKMDKCHKKKDHLTRGKACLPVQAFFRGWFIRFGERKLLFLDIRSASTFLQGFYGFGVLKKMMPVDSGQTLYRVIARSPRRKSQVVSKTPWIMIFPPFVRLGMMSMFTKPWFSDVIRNGTFTCELTSWESLVGQFLILLDEGFE